MKVFQVSKFKESPVFAETADPVPGRGEVLIAVAACGLNFADLLMMKGQYQDTPPLPLTLGMEIAGRIVACGPEVSGFAVGDRVAACPGSGGLATYCVVRAERCVRLPKTMPMDEAAAFQIAYGTSHLALTDRAALAAGDTIAILGAAGGVGLTAVEIAAKLGARVVAIARGPEKRAIARAAGAVETLDSENGDLRGALKALGGMDVVYDAVGDPLASEALRACRPGARYLAIGFAAGQIPAFRLNYLLVKNITVHGFYWGGYLTFAPEKLTGSLATLLEWYVAGELRPHISHRIPFDRATEGLDLLRSRRSAGKVVITL